MKPKTSAFVPIFDEFCTNSDICAGCSSLSRTPICLPWIQTFRASHGRVRLHLKVHVWPRSKLILRIRCRYDRPHLPFERLVVFVASTTGDAEAPETMTTFWRLHLQLFKMLASFFAFELSAPCVHKVFTSSKSSSRSAKTRQVRCVRSWRLFIPKI